MKRNSVVTGTLWLTAAGLISRLLGFVYRIYLSGLIGSEGMGLYQLISPIYFLLFTLCSAGCHTAISQMVAAESAHRHTQNMQRILWICLVPSTALALLFVLLIQEFSPWIAVHIIQDARAAEGVRILCLGLPFCVSSSCFKAYFHGIRQMKIPATEQVIEQICRMSVIYMLAPLLSQSDVTTTCSYVVYGTVAGDFISCLYTGIAYGIHRRRLPYSSYREPFPSLLRPLLLIILPVTGSRLLTQLLSSFENIMLPSTLQRFGLSSSESLSLYGEFSGMVMPLLSFPTIITSALSSNLLPLVASAKASRNYRLIQTATYRSLRLTFMIAFLFSALFASLGLALGNLLYPGTNAGIWLPIVGLFCPFFYLQNTLSGLLTGSGLQNEVFLYQIIASGLRIILMLSLVPLYGFPAFLLGMLASLILSSILGLRKLILTYHMKLSFLKEIATLFVCSAATFLLSRLTAPYVSTAPSLCLAALAASAFYLLALFLTRCLTKKDLQEVLLLVKPRR